LRTLSRFVDGTLNDARRARVLRHLERCARCRATLVRLRALGDAARQNPAPPPPADALDRILARRAAGERVILPAGEPVAARPAPRRALMAACAAAVVAAGALLLPRPELQASASELRFSPERPAPGATVRVEYRPGSLLRGERQVRLRARLRTPSGESYQAIHARQMAVLRREGDVFRGSFTLPDSVVYAAFAVEDPAGAGVDDNGSRAWELLAHGPDGRPLYVSLTQRINDLYGRNWQEAYETARRAAGLYPDTVGVWNRLYFFERNVLGDANADSLRAGHLRRLHALERTLAARRPGADEMAMMMWYAKTLRDSTAAARWSQRLLATDPAQPEAVQERSVRLYRELHGRPAELLREMDRMWDQVGPRHDWQGQAGFDAARALNEPAAVLRWAERYLHFRPAERAEVAGDVGRLPALREHALGWLRAEAARLDTTQARDLARTVDEQRRVNARHRARALAAAGRILLDAGRTRAGLDTLELAAAAGWDPALFSAIGGARLAAGDSAGGLRVLARVAADPGTRAARADSLARTAAASSLAGSWEGWMDEARREMRGRLMVNAVSRRVSGRLALQDPDGASRPLAEIAAGGPAVVVFWSRFCGPAIEALPGLVQMRERLARQGARLVVVADERPSDAFRAFLRERGVGFTVYHDARREASVAFGNWGTPMYYVLDADGRIRFERVDPSAVPRLVAVLGSEG
jgi:hypothetical protein